MRRVLYLWVPHLQTEVERLLAPALAGQPLVVASGSFARGMVVDASPEAEALGAGTGQSWRHARRHAPQAVFIPYEPWRYRPFTERIGGLLYEVTPWVEMLPGSEGEFFADLGAGSLEEGERLARWAVDAVRDVLALEAFAGLASGKLVARTVCRRSAFGVPPLDGPDLNVEHQPLTSERPLPSAVPSGLECRFLRSLSLDYLWDMQPEHRRRLGPLGLRTFGQLAGVPQRLLIGQFGPIGRWYRLLAAGIDTRRVKPWNPCPTVSRHLLIEEDGADLPLLEGYLDLLARRVSDTLVATGQYTRVVSLMLEMDGARPYASRHLKAPTNLPGPIYEVARGLLVQAVRHSGRMPERLTLTASALETRGLIQLSLFDDPERGPALRAAIARIQDRFGETAISTGVKHRALGVRNSFPTADA